MKPEEVALLGLDKIVTDQISVEINAPVDAGLPGLVESVQNGQYLDVLNAFQSTSLNKGRLIHLCEQTDNPFYAIHGEIIDYLSAGPADGGESKLFLLLVLAVSYLQLYVQCNYTGPEFTTKVREQLSLSTDAAHNVALMHLECDGNFPFKVELPHLLLIARILLAFLADPFQASWRENAVLDEDGKLLIPLKKGADLDKLRALLAAVPVVPPDSVHWWAARAIVLHCRALQAKTYETMCLLWLQAKLSFQQALSVVCGLLPTADMEKDNTFQLSHTGTPILQGMLWLEWGLAEHSFGFGDKGKKAFHRAQTAVHLETYVTAALGKRTKYQREEVAQLYLYAKSSLIGEDSPQPPKQEVQVQPPPAQSDGDAATTGWQHSEFELGRRMVKEAADGEEAAVREVLLDSVEGGAAENIIIEGGPRFAEGTVVDKGGLLHPVDQAIILSLCLDVCNSNPADGLTNEQMLPFIERVLDQASNWMVHSTALLERSWLEFERRKTMDRSLLQIQALIDQHSTKLTVMQSSFQIIEDSAPVQQRIQYIYGLVYPSQFELKRDLADRYLRCQVFMSALAYFRELEMWDEVVTCYQLLQKPHRAELVVREQLRLGETPYMVTSLADLTGQEELYERAWTLSQHRYPRAKRTLAKICHDRGDYAQAIAHLSAALQVQPMVATAWYLKGIACMRIERWEEGVQAFMRCVQQDSEIGEAWANIGAIYMRLQDWPKAYHALTEAYKQKREGWKVLENLLNVTLSMQRWKESIRVMTSLVDLRHKSDRPVHIRQLRYLMKVIVTECANEQQSSDGQRSEATSKMVTLPELAVHLETLLQKITSKTKSDPQVWDVVAEFYDSFGHFMTALDARLKQVWLLLLYSGALF